MTEKELKKLSRAELLKMLIIQTERVETLELELEEKENSYKQKIQTLEESLNDKKIVIEKAGSIAEASLALNKVFEAAQQAADLYLENIKELYHQSDEKKLETDHEQKE